MMIEDYQSTIRLLEMDLTSIKTTNQRLQTRCYKLEDAHDKQLDEISHERAVAANNLRRMICSETFLKWR